MAQARGRDVTLVLCDRRQVHWGGPERSADKARLLAAVLAAQPTASTIDVSDPDVVVVR